MSSTKIVIIVLVLVGVLFVIFVVRGAFRGEPEPKSDRQAANKTKPPDWTKKIEGLFSSLKPGLTLDRDSYSSHADQKILPDAKHPFRTATFHLIDGKAKIKYEDKTPIEPGSKLGKDMDNPQICNLPDFDKSDSKRCAIIAFKGGGTFTFDCEANSTCKVVVE